jgi:hypothetical protein
VEPEIFCTRSVRSTASKALEMSIIAAAVQLGGLFSLNPLATQVTKGKRAVVVERPAAKPCSVLEMGRPAQIRGKSKRSSILTTEESKEIGR